MCRCASIVASLALLVAGTALAQLDTRTSRLSSGKRAPADVIRGVDAESITEAVEGHLDIVEFSPAYVLSTKRVKLKGVGDAVRYNIRYEVTIHNPGNLARQFRIITDVADEPRARSAQFEVLPGQRVSKTQTAMFIVPAEGLVATLGLLDPRARPIRVHVIDAAGQELDSVNLALEDS
jgi:hypothetical protein